MKKLVLPLLLVLIIGIIGCASNNMDNKDAFEIVKKVNEKYKDMQSFKAVRITKQQGFIITAIEDLYFKGYKYKIVEDNHVEVSDGKTIWNYKVDNEAPDKVELYLPEDDAITNKEPEFNFDMFKVNKEPEFNFDMIRIDAEIYSYTLQIDKNKEFSSDNLPELADGNEYYWRIYAIDTYGNSNKGNAEIRKFKVDDTINFEDKAIIPESDKDITQIQYNNNNPKMFLFTRIDYFNESQIEKMRQYPWITIKGNIIKANRKDAKIKNNKIIYYLGELAKPEISNKDFNYKDYIQWVYNILDLYALNFKIEGEENNHYIIKGTEAKDRVNNFLWSSVEVWVNKDDYTIWKLRLYQEADGKEYLTEEYIYEDVSFDELSDELFEYHEEKKEID